MEIFDRIGKTNYVAIGITVACMAILLSYELKLKSVIGKKCKFPVPIQLILVIAGTATAWGLDLHQSYGLRVVGNVPTG
jgi:solute carrier family 26 protein